MNETVKSMEDGVVDDEEFATEDAYDLSRLERKRENEHFGAQLQPMPLTSVEPAEDGPVPEWVAKFQRDVPAAKLKLTGKCAKWNTAKGFGFVTRDDGGPDVYVHQRDLKKEGFRSLLEGEPVVFEVSRMEDGRLHGIKVTGPGGLQVQGQPHKARDNDDDFDDDGRRGAGGPSRRIDEKKAASPSKSPYKPALAFKPRTLKPAAAKPAAVKPASKPAGGGSAAAAEQIDALA